MKYASNFVKEKLGDAEIAIVLGSGLGDLVEILQDKKVRVLRLENRVYRDTIHALDFCCWTWKTFILRFDW